MNTSVKRQTSLWSQFWNTAMNKTLSALVPLHARRAYFMSTLAAHFREQGTPDNVLAKELVRSMGIDMKPAALLFFLNKKDVWPELPKQINQSDACITQDELDRLNSQVVRIMPEWLRYSNERTMRKDVQRAIAAVSACTPSGCSVLRPN